MAKYSVLLVGLICIVFIFKPMLFDSPSRKIQNKLIEFSGTVKKLPQDMALKKAGQISAFSGFFAPEAEIRIDHPKQQIQASSRAELTEYFKYYLGDSTMPFLSIHWVNPTIQLLGSPPTHATVQTDVVVETNASTNWLQAPVRIQFQKLENQWKITNIQSP
jgi:hypothetical protein